MSSFYRRCRCLGRPCPCCCSVLVVVVAATAAAVDVDVDVAFVILLCRCGWYAVVVVGMLLSLLLVVFPVQTERLVCCGFHYACISTNE